MGPKTRLRAWALKEEQLTLLAPIGEAHARRTDPVTSHQAAATVNTARLEALVVDALTELEAATMHTVATHLARELVSISPRFKPLEKKGLIEKCGRRGRRTLYRAKIRC